MSALIACLTAVWNHHVSLYGNTIKKADHVKYAFEKGIDLYATDSEADLKNIAKHAPGSKIFVRILVQGSETAEWPLSRKFGCHPNMAIDLLVQARELGLVPYAYPRSTLVVSKKMSLHGMMR